MLRLLALSLLFVGLAAGAVAAPGPCDDVPLDYWAYRAVDQLKCDWCPTLSSWGTIITAPRTLSRYEFAMLTARICRDLSASEDAENEVTSLQLSSLLKLVDEFALELSVLMDVWPDRPAEWTTGPKALVHCLPSVLKARPPELSVVNCPDLAGTPPDHWAYESTKRLYELGIFEAKAQR